MIPVVIDGQSTEIAPGATILEAARSLGIEIPTLCHEDSLEPAGTCRICSVEITVDGRSRIVPACKYSLEEPARISTNSARAAHARDGILRNMLSRWPNVQVLRDLASRFGVEEPETKHPARNHNEHACILCGLCVRICGEGLWHHALAFHGKGSDRHVAMVTDDGASPCVGCGACAAVCPSGAITMLDDPNHPADGPRIRRAGMVITSEMLLLDKLQCRMREVGTGHLVEIMNDYDLLPVHNFRFGSHPDAEKIASHHFKARYFTQGVADGCGLGCDMACAKAVDDFVLKTGPDKGKSVIVDGPEYETLAGCGANLGNFDPECIIELNYYCDHYGIDTISFGTLTAFVMECFANGILDLERTGGLDLRFGNGQAALELLHQMARGEGFGLVAGQGTRRMKAIFAAEYGADPAFLQDIAMEAKGMEYSEYVTKESLAQQGGYGIALKGAQHDEAWLIFMDMVNKQIPTFEDKAEALHYFPMWRTWFGLNGLCKLPWNDVEPADNAQQAEPHKVPLHTQGYCDFFAGMTGKEVTPADLILQSERVYNFQRIFNLKMGFGRRKHDSIPYRSMGPVTQEEYLSRQDRYDSQLREELGLDTASMNLSEKRAALRKLREQRYESLLDAVYKRRGWTPDGVPTEETCRRLGIHKVEGLMDLIAPHQQK